MVHFIWRKIELEILSVEKNYKYEVCGDIIWANNQGDIIWGGNQRWQESRQATPIRDRGTVQNAEVGSQTDCATIR